MTIQNNQYSQLHDFLSQVMAFSSKEGLPKITQGMVAEKLKIDSSGVSKFLNGTTKNPKKMMTNFIGSHPDEIQRWPVGADKIHRLIVKSDVCYFLQLPNAQCTNTVKKLKQIPSMPNAPIAISYRGHQSEKDAAGMCFDHMRMQVITRHPTVALIPTKAEVQTAAQSIFKHNLSQHGAALPYGVKDAKLITHPPFQISCENDGLLIIPGRVRAIENEPERLAHEYAVIRKALNRGQPLLCLCAGSWRLYEQLLIWTKFPEKLNATPTELLQFHAKNNTTVDVKDHCYNGGMLRLGTNGRDAVLNVQIHDISIEEGSFLKEAFFEKEVSTETLTVNSVHWKAVASNIRIENVRNSALAVQNDGIKINNRHQELMEPEENSVEAFETIFGVPVFGIQWHPEGYDSRSPHANLIRYMTLAGDAYAAKRNMLKELISMNH